MPVDLGRAHQKQRARGRDQHADAAVGRDIGRHARRPVRFRAGSRRETRRPRCPGSTTSPPPRARPAPRTAANRAGSVSVPAAGSIRSGAVARTPASRGGGRMFWVKNGTCSASVSRRPRGIPACRACRPAREQPDGAEIDAGSSRIHTSSVEPDSASGSPGREAEQQHGSAPAAEIHRETLAERRRGGRPQFLGATEISEGMSGRLVMPQC